MLPLVATAAACAFGLSLVLTICVRALGRRRALLDGHGAAGHTKLEVRPVPNIGGIAIFWAIALPIATGLVLIRLTDNQLGPITIPDALSDHIPGMRAQLACGFTLLACMLGLHIVGLIDDRKPMGALPKLAFMALAALSLIIPFDVRLLEAADGYVGGAWLSITLTLLWFLAVTNAMNFMDNMDGLAGGVGVVASAFFMLAALSKPEPQWFVGLTLAVLIGALLGFLVFNAPLRGRASIFMGDGGSLVVGFLLAFLTVRTTYVPVESAGDGASSWYAVFMPLCVLAVPIYDLCSVSLIRLSQGKSPFVGDQQHLSHRLRARGLSVWQTLAVVYGITALTGLSGVFLARLDGWAAALAGAQVVVALVVLGVLEHGSSRTASA